VLGQDPQCLGMVGDDTAADLRDLLAQLLGRQEAQLAAGEFLDEHAGAGYSRGIETTLLFPTRRTFTIFMPVSIYTDVRQRSVRKSLE
jgi:hypothetical protein